MTIINGFLFSIGFTIGFFITAFFLLAFLVKLIKAGKRYKKEDLLSAFTEYLERMKNDEVYEAAKEVEFIIKNLEKDVHVDEIKNYEIESSTELKMNNVYDKISLRFTDVIKIVKRK